MRSRAETVSNYAILVVFAGLALVPMIGVLVAAVQPPGTLQTGVAAPRGFSLDNLTQAWTEGHFGSYLKSSVLVSVSVVVATVALATAAAYAFGTMSFRGRTPLFYLFLAGLMVPQEALLVPLYYDLRSVGLTDTYWALILPQIAQSLSFGTFWMRAYFRATPRSVIEAARIDGASSWATLWRILVPMGRPAILTMTVLVFMWTWNEFLLALVMVHREDLRTVPLGLTFFQGAHSSDFSLLAAASVIVALPVVLLYVFLQRHFIAGMLSGAIKE